MCKAYNCSSPAPENTYCTLHAKVFGKSSGTIKVQSELPKETAKTKSVKAELKKLYPEFLKKKGFKCEVKTSVCTKAATVIHHVKGRGKNEILNQDTWMASCLSCNSRIESHPNEGVKGAKVSRHKKK